MLPLWYASFPSASRQQKCFMSDNKPSLPGCWWLTVFFLITQGWPATPPTNIISTTWKSSSNVPRCSPLFRGSVAGHLKLPVLRRTSCCSGESLQPPPVETTPVGTGFRPCFVGKFVCERQPLPRLHGFFGRQITIHRVYLLHHLHLHLPAVSNIQLEATKTPRMAPL